MKLSTRLLSGVLLAASSAALALTPREMTPAERRSLPSWCELTQGFDRNPDAPGHYNDHVARYGEGWTHVHHYCWALASIIRSHRFDQSLQGRRHLIASAIDDLDYVLNNAPNDFILRHEILIRKAKLLGLHGESNRALTLAREIVQAWPDRADSYGLLAEILVTLGRNDEAQDVLSAAEGHVKDRARLDQIRAVLGR